MANKLLYALIASLPLGFMSCTNTDEPLASQVSSEITHQDVSDKSKEIADLITSIPLDDDIINEVFSAVSNGLENGVEESYYFAEVFSDTSTKSAQRSGNSGSKLGNEIRQILNSSRSQTFIETDILAYGDYQIYWPYSEDWDGKTKPVITFVPKDASQLWNYGFKQTDDGIDTIVVNEEYMATYPVWIINKADIPYDELPNFNGGESYKNGITYIPRKSVSSIETSNNQEVANSSRVAGEPVYTVYLGQFMSDKNYDDVWNGGSEFAIQMGAIENMVITSQEQLRATNPAVTYIRITRSRSDIKKKRWTTSNAVLSSDWQPNENNAGFCIYEEDQGGTKHWDMSLSIKIKGTDYSFTLKMPYGSGDDYIYRVVYSRNFMFSTNNTPGTQHSANRVYWTLPYKVGYTVI